MPARHTSLQDGLLLEADFERRLWSTKEGVGETSGQTAGSYFLKSSLFCEKRSGRRNRFSSFGADLKVRNFTGLTSLKVKSGPDVFADALVPMPALIKPGARFPQNPSQMIVLIPRPCGSGFLRDQRYAIAAMVIALPNGRVNRIPRSG
jgi:hypothetical protein